MQFFYSSTNKLNTATQRAFISQTKQQGSLFGSRFAMTGIYWGQALMLRRLFEPIRIQAYFLRSLLDQTKEGPTNPAFCITPSRAWGQQPKYNYRSEQHNILLEHVKEEQLLYLKVCCWKRCWKEQTKLLYSTLTQHRWIVEIDRQRCLTHWYSPTSSKLFHWSEFKWKMWRNICNQLFALSF